MMISRCQLFDLPPEILIRILLYLPLPTLLTCHSVNRHLHDLVSSSVEIQYALYREFAMQLNTDNPLCLVSVKERLTQLSTREIQWQKFTCDSQNTTNIAFRTSGIYDLSGGIFLLGDASRRMLHYAYLPSTSDKQVVWKSIATDHLIIDMGLCVYEHDLIAVITLHAQTPNMYEIQLQLHSVSTGLFHPEAKQPIISVVAMPWQQPAAGIEIVGDNLVLILTYYTHEGHPDDQVFIYKWKTGSLKMSVSAPQRSYSGLLFLTTNIILLPNTTTEQLEYWKIPPDNAHVESPRPFFAICLPELKEAATYDSISCRADPNPTSTYRHSSRPFHADPHHAIAIFSITIHVDRFGGGGSDPNYFLLFVHRSSLVQCLDRYPSCVSYDGDPEPIPYSEWGQSICRWLTAGSFPARWITTTSGQRCIIIPDPISHINTPLVLLNFNQNDVTKLHTVEKRKREMRVHARLIKQRSTELGATRQNLGQHTMTFDHTTPETMVSNSTLDIPSYEWLYDDSNGIDGLMYPRGILKSITRKNVALTDRYQCFQDSVYSGLSFTVYPSKRNHNFQGVMLDEERVLGLRTDANDRITALDILFYG